MRLRRKPWIDDAIKQYASFVHLESCEENKGKWRTLFANPDAPLWVELGTGKGNFISKMAELHPEINFMLAKSALKRNCTMYSCCALT